MAAKGELRENAHAVVVVRAPGVVASNPDTIRLQEAVKQHAELLLCCQRALRWPDWRVADALGVDEKWWACLRRRHDKRDYSLARGKLA
jgi:hypothetical protein